MGPDTIILKYVHLWKVFFNTKGYKIGLRLKLQLRGRGRAGQRAWVPPCQTPAGLTGSRRVPRGAASVLEEIPSPWGRPCSRDMGGGETEQVTGTLASSRWSPRWTSGSGRTTPLKGWGAAWGRRGTSHSEARRILLQTHLPQRWASSRAWGSLSPCVQDARISDPITPCL